MSSSSFYRVSTSNMYDSTLRNLNARQKSLVDLQENLTTGKRVVRPSDDPVAAAQAERAQTRLARNETDVRALNMQRNSMALAESTLGEAGDAMQEFRALVVNAGNGAYTQTERDAIAQQLVSLRDQIFSYANRKDSNGLPLFQALGSAEQPFTGQLAFAGLPGQVASGATSIANVLDGFAAWTNVPTGNGVFTVDVNAANQGKAWADVGQVTDPSTFAASTVDNYRIVFSGTADAPTYDVQDVATGLSVLPAAPPPPLPFPASATTTSTPVTLSFDGISIGISGKPAPGDEFTVTRNSADPDTRSNVFQVLDNIIGAIRNGSNPDGSTASGQLTHALTRGLAEIDASMNRMQAARGFAGDLLNRADRIENDLGTRAIQLEADRSRAEDLDMIQGISDFQNQQVGYEAALKSYAQVQKLSLFNFIS